ncbi:MAG: GNAT family N-acetyltransferase [Chloroflexi bacterium]|nr:MAG: GNAT family N-acetyltransferase [Chloroflexota bacterium]
MFRLYTKENNRIFPCYEFGDPMNSEISLREVTPENYDTIISMKVREDQKNFVASNVHSLAEACVFPGRKPMAIYAGEIPVGFLMFTYWEERQQHWIFRLMIAAEHQRQGYGQAAMLLLIERMRAIPGCHQIFISYEPENQAARMLYSNLGFRPTGEIEGGEEVACLELS